MFNNEYEYVQRIVSLNDLDKRLDDQARHIMKIGDRLSYMEGKINKLMGHLGIAGGNDGE